MAIVKHRNFGRAATALGATQPALSRRISAFERRLDVTLFSRARRQIELTPAGEALAREAPALLAQADLATRSLREVARGSRGHVRLGTRSSSRYVLIPKAIRRLRAQNPHFSVTVSDQSPGRQLEQVRAGALDLTVVHGPLKLDRSLRRALLRIDPMVVALPARHPLAERPTVDARDLAEETFLELRWHESCDYQTLQRGACARAGFVPRIVHEVTTIDALAMCVAGGIGVALMHDVRNELPIPDVVFRPLRPDATSVELNAVWRADDRNPVIEPFIECLAAAANASDASL